MKKIISFLAVATFALFITNCGSNSGNTPASMQKAMYTQLQKGNYAKAVEILFDNMDDGSSSAKPEEKAKMLQAFTEKAKQSVEAKGGLKKFEITGEEFSEDGLKATVTTKLVYGNGKEDTDTSSYVKKDGKWKLSMGK